MFRFAAAAVLLAAPAFAQQSFELKTEGDDLTLTIADDGIEMLEFVKLAQHLTGRVFTFSKEDLAGAEPMKLTGAVHMKKDEFLPFFQTRLYIEGFALQTRRDGDREVLEIVPVPRSGPQQPGSDASYVAVDKLEDHKTKTAPILTAIPLAHVAPQHAIERVRTALAATTNDALLGQTPKALLVQGTGADVYCVWRMVRLIDAPPNVVIEVVALEHAVAAELASGLKALVAGRQPAVVVLAHESTNALMISGPRAVVDETVEVARLLDRAAKK